MCSLVNKQLLLTAYAYLFIMEQQKELRGSDALNIKGGHNCCITNNNVYTNVSRPAPEPKNREETPQPPVVEGDFSRYWQRKQQSETKITATEVKQLEELKDMEETYPIAASVVKGRSGWQDKTTQQKIAAIRLHLEVGVALKELKHMEEKYPDSAKELAKQGDWKQKTTAEKIAAIKEHAAAKEKAAAAEAAAKKAAVAEQEKTLQEANSPKNQVVLGIKFEEAVQKL